MGYKFGYARVSTVGQHLDRQVESIKRYCPDINDRDIFVEKISGKRGVDERQEYMCLRRMLRAGDELIIDSLDRLGRNKKGIKDELEFFKNNGIVLRVLMMPTTLIEIDGQAWVMEMINNLLIEVYSSLSEHELVEKERRQRAGIEEAKKRGVYRGRKPIEIDSERFGDLYDRWKSGAIRAKEFMDLMELKPNTFYRAVQRYEKEKAV